MIGFETYNDISWLLFFIISQDINGFCFAVGKIWTLNLFSAFYQWNQINHINHIIEKSNLESNIWIQSRNEYFIKDSDVLWPNCHFNIC